MSIATLATGAPSPTPVIPLFRSGSRAPAIVCEHVSKRFSVYERRPSTLRELFVRAVGRRPVEAPRAEFSLRDFTLRVDRGESVALVGGNGSGKSTALRLIAGIYHPSSGRVVTHGRVAAIIELGVGFHPDLTGVENVFHYAAAIGLRRSETRARLAEVLDFADIGAFVHEPTRFYSTGMRARLAFAAAMLCQKPDILLLDEVLSVGDQAFQARCERLIHDFRAGGGTIVVVSHDAHTLAELCDRAVWLENGVVRMEGRVGEVLQQYSCQGTPKDHQPLSVT